MKENLLKENLLNDNFMNDKATSFVFDWKDRIEIQQRKFNRISIIIYSLAFIICVVLFFWFQNKNYERVIERNMNYIQDSALQETNQIENRMENVENTLIYISNRYAAMVETEEDLTVTECLKILDDKNIFDRLGFVNLEGIEINTKENIDVSDRGYCKKALEGQTGWELIEVSHITGKPVIIFYAPVIVENEIIGAMVGVYEEERINGLFSYQLFNYKPDVHLLLGDGTEIANSAGDPVSRNFLEELSQKEFIGNTDYDDICDALKDTGRITSTFSYRENKETLVGVIVQFNKSDCMLVSVLPYDITKDMVKSANRVGIIVMVAIVLLFIVIVCLLLFFYQKQRGLFHMEMTNAAESLKIIMQDEINKESQAKQALQEAYEAARIANDAKTTFLSNMSHDIRTPMNAIVGLTAIAAANIDNIDKVTDCLNKINSSSKHLLGLINEVLDMSKIESGTVDLVEDEFSLSDMMDSLINVHQPLVKEKNHTLVIKINNLMHENVIGDCTRLQQVFSNLLSNAIKYTPEKGRIEVTLSEKETNKPTVGWYEAVIKDSGIGMSEEFLDKLFEPFSRANNVRTAGIQGTGLGMPIAKNIISMMNGNISVESKENVGTTFTISFALRLQMDEEINYEEFLNLPVLVVDDDEVACESTCTILDSLSMNSEWVTSGKEAVEKTVERHNRGEDYYAVILDWKMPDMDGVETARQIRKQIGEDVPIIILSSYDWTDIEHEAKKVGVNTFLSKPLFKSKLITLFDSIVSKNNININQTKNDLKKNDFSGKRALIVEDNELNSEIAVELLSMLGLETETAENGRVGAEKFEQSPVGYYDIILMDIQMPELNGYEATKTIRAMSHPDASTIPIVAMSANAFSTDVRAAYDSGMNGHISKPIDISHVVKVLNEKLG